jgi:predicted PurR-regulated permease PerM
VKRDYLFHTFFLAAFVLLLYAFLRIIEPFVTPMLGAVVLFILANPVNRRFAIWFPRRSPSFHAALATIVVACAIVVPFFIGCWILFNEAQNMGPLLQEWGVTLRNWRAGHQLMDIDWMRSLQRILKDSLGVGRVDFERFAVQTGGEVFGWVTTFGRLMARNAVLSLANMLVMVFTLFFLFRDGENLFLNFKRLIPMRLEHKDRIADRLRVTVTELVRGSVLTALFQTICATTGYLLAGVPAAMTLGAATGMAAFIPFVGTALVWLPTALYYLSQDQIGKGLFLLGWGAICVSLLDNLIRTLWVGKRAELPLLFLFFSIVGGIKMYGIKGLLIGPLLVAIIPVFVDIYRDQFLRKELPEAVEYRDEFS